MEFCLHTVLVLTVSTTAVLGFPMGAPTDACTNGLMPAGHTNPANMAGDDVPYYVNISTIGSYYIPGYMYEIVLSGGMQGADFRGFIIQAQTVADDSPTGTFTAGDNSQPQCTNTAATHTNRDDKTMVTLTWTAPPAETGVIRFVYTFVDRYSPANNLNVFWAGLETAMISEAPLAVMFNQSAYRVDEDAGPVQPVVVINRVSANDTTFEVYDTSGTAGDEDYTSGPYPVTIPAGETYARFDIAINNDDMFEYNENFTLNINASSLPTNVSVGNIGEATVTIVDDDTTFVTFEQSTYTVGEGAGEIRPVLVLSRSSLSVVTVYAYNTDGTAMGDDDYAPGPYYVMFPVGMTTASFNISIFDDSDVESNENFMLTINSTALSNGFSAGNPNVATVTITDNDGGGGAAAVMSSIATLLFASIIALII